MQPDLDKLLSETENLVKETAGFIRSVMESELEVEEKSKNSLVTFADKESEARLVKGLKKIFPDAGIVGEEDIANDKRDEYNWIIDPIDGTTNFIHSIPCFSISVALAYKSEILSGIVHEINLDQCFTARKGGGAYLNGSRIAVSDRRQFKDTLLATGFPYYDYDNMDEYLNLLHDLMKSTRGLRRLGSAAVDLAYVACGKFDGFYEYGLSPWDVAAGALLVQEAGGMVTDFKGGNNYLYGNEIVAASSYSHNDLLIAISKHFGN